MNLDGLGFTTTYKCVEAAKVHASRIRHHLLWVGLWVRKSAQSAVNLILCNLRFDLGQRKVRHSRVGEQSSPARLWSWSNGVPGFTPARPCPASLKKKQPTIVHSELGLGLSQRKIQRLISKSRITDLRNGGQHSYVSARRLFWVIRELQAVANGESAHTRHQ